MGTTTHDAKALFDWIEQFLYAGQLENHECPSEKVCYLFLKDDGWTVNEIEYAYQQLVKRGIIFSTHDVFSGHWKDDDEKEREP